MSREMELRHLEQANRHIAEGEQRIAKQKARIAGLEQRGHDATVAIQLLQSFEDILDLIIEHRRRILQELDRISN